MEKRECDLVIIGSGPAGMMAAIYASRAGLNTLLLESTGAGGQILSTSEIDNFPGFISITGAELAMKMSEQVENCGVETVYDEIAEITLGHKKTIICSDTTITAKAIIVATGASPRRIGCENEEKFIGRGVHFCALCDGAFYKDKDIVVIGGGNSAVEEALYLSPIAKSVTIVNITQKFTGFASLVERLDKLQNVKVFHETSVAKIIGNEKVEGIETKQGTIIPCQGIFVAIGRKPNTSFLPSHIDLTGGGYISVTKKLETSVPGIYAAGDVCDKHVRQIVTACSDGAIAATHAVEHIRSLHEQ